MNDTDKTFLFDLLNTPSPSGFEAAGQRVWAKHLRAHGVAVESDAYGSAWGRVPGAGGDGAPRVMLEAHADEIGLIVNHITDEGFIHFRQIGGLDRAIARARRVRLLGDKGEVAGIVGNTAIHIRETKDEKVPEWHDLFIDVGATSRDEVLAMGLRVGTPGVYADEVTEVGAGRLVGRALDNRIGGFVVARALRRLAEGAAPAATVFGLNAVQEEIGGHGATMATYRLRPNVAVVIDVTHATDSPGISKAKHGATRLGGGPTVTHGTSNHPAVVRRLLEVAEAEGIPIQHEASSRYTGTDTDSVFVSGQGVPSALVSLPMRYMHSTVEMVDLEDVERCVRLLAAFARSVQADDAFAVTV